MLLPLGVQGHLDRGDRRFGAQFHTEKSFILEVFLVYRILALPLNETTRYLLGFDGNFSLIKFLLKCGGSSQIIKFQELGTAGPVLSVEPESSCFPEDLRNKCSQICFLSVGPLEPIGALNPLRRLIIKAGTTWRECLPRPGRVLGNWRMFISHGPSNSGTWMLYPHFTAEGTKGQWLPKVTNSKRHDLNSCPSSKSVLLITFVVWCFNNYSLVISMLFFSATYLLNDLGWVSSISSLFWGRGEQFQFLRKISNLYPKLTELTCETPCTHYTYTTTI